MLRRDFIKIIGISAGAMSLGCKSGDMFAAKSRPNILWLIAEDLSPDLGCYGNRLVKTPNLDKLASEGTMFTNVFATASVCSPSRSAFLTGMYQTSIDSHHHRTSNPRPLAKGNRLISEHFRENGYFVFNGEADNLSAPGKMDVNFLYDESSIEGTDWRQRKNGQPFFGMIQFKETHRDFVRDTKNPIDPAAVELPPYYADHQLVRRDWANYLEDIQILDGKVGGILRRLEADGADNTIIVFLGDHGRPMIRDKQFLYDGGIHIPLIIKWPGGIPAGKTEDSLISTIDIGPSCMRLAGIDIPGHIHGRPFVDNNTAEREFIFAARDRCGEAADRIRCVRSKKYKYIRNFHPNIPYTQFSAYKEIQYPVLHLMRQLYCENKLNDVQKRFMAAVRPYQELYDIEKDPFEINDLSQKAEFQGILNDFSGQLDQWIKDTNDAGEIPEDYQAEVQWYINNQKWYSETLKERGITNDTPAAHVEYWTTLLGG